MNKKRKLLSLAMSLANYVLPLLVMLVSFASYTLLERRQLSSATVFSAISLFSVFSQSLVRSSIWLYPSLRTFSVILGSCFASSLSSVNCYLLYKPLIFFLSLLSIPQSTFFRLSSYIEAYVSLKRLNTFLHDTQLIDRYHTQGDVVTSLAHDVAVAAVPTTQEDPDYIGFTKATFTWSREAAKTAEQPAGTSTTVTAPSPVVPDESARNFKLVLDDLRFPRGVVSLISGPTGSGKTSILLALLGEMHFESAAQPGSSFSLPRKGGISFADQASWLQNATLKENILFGEAYDEERYKKVVYQCALERDFELFDAGDKTEVGEKGLSLRFVSNVLSFIRLVLVDGHEISVRISLIWGLLTQRFHPIFPLSIIHLCKHACLLKL